MSKLIESTATAVLTVALGCLGGCSSKESCSYNHQTYPKGASFPAEDGCNTCTCMAAGQVACTLIGCLADAGPPSPDMATPDAQDAAIADAPPDAPLPIDTGASEGAAPVDYCLLPTGLTFYVYQTIQVPGSIASYTVTYHLDNTGLVITRDYWNGYDGGYLRACMPALPACALTDQVTVWNVGADLADPAVKAAFASTPNTLFGTAPRPSDAWTVAVDTGGAIVVGLPCPTLDAGTCRAIPPALQRLKDDLQALAAAGVAQPACVELLKP